LGATNGWFPVTLSVLAIPTEKDQLGQLLLDGWDYFSDAESEEQIKWVIKTLAKDGKLPGIDKWDHRDVWKAIQERKKNKDSAQTVSESDIKGPEWEVLTSDSAPSDWPHFLSRKTDVPENFADKLSGVSLLERLREVNALIGYTRVEAPDESVDIEERPIMVALCKGKPEWIPANEVHGEGVFITFNENAVSLWEQRDAVKARSEMLENGHRGWRNSKKLDPNEGYPGVRYAMLHTFAHVLIRELALECGYNAASIRERIYAKKDEDNAMAGVLLYTAAADSDGTLGGLVELGKKDHLGRLMEQALKRAEICSSDPLCAEHDPGSDRSLHATACHACTFVAETSCERGNRYLDRALLVSTMDTSGAAFFA
jgi:hypothetical protein